MQHISPEHPCGACPLHRHMQRAHENLCAHERTIAEYHNIPIILRRTTRARELRQSLDGYGSLLARYSRTFGEFWREKLVSCRGPFVRGSTELSDWAIHEHEEHLCGVNVAQYPVYRWSSRWLARFKEWAPHGE